MATIHAKKRIFVSVVILVAILLIGGGAIYFIKPFAKPKTVEAQVTFTFDPAKAPGWWAGDNNFPAEQPNMSDTHPALVQRTIAQGTPEKPGTCFVMYFYYEGEIDTSFALQQQEKNTVDGTEKTLEKIGAKTFTMQTMDGTKEFQLHQYNDTDAHAKQSVAGIEFGYVVTDDGYIDIRGYCEKTEQLDATVPVFSAVKLKES